MHRRHFLGAGSSLAFASTFPKPALAQTAEPIRIGLMAPLTGVAAAGGREIVDGFNLFWEQAGNQIAGRKVEVLVEDDGSNPDIALQKARRLVEQSKANFLFGNLLANTGLAVANYVKGTGTPYFIPVIAADDLTQRSRIRNVIRVGGFSASQFSRPLADWALKQGYKKAVLISQDYTFGHEQCGGFAQTFTEGGGQVLQQFWHPLNTSDFSPYLGQIANLGADFIYGMETGADANRLIQQFASFGLKGRLPFLAAQNTADQSVIRTLGPECDGLISAASFCEGLENATTQKFVADSVTKTGRMPSFYGASHYTGAMWVAKAIETLKGKIEDTNAFIDTVLKTTLDDSPFGKPMKLDSYGNPVYDVYVRKVVKNMDGKYWNVPVATYPNVSQFWTYDPETYMKQPPYSRDYQGPKKG